MPVDLSGVLTSAGKGVAAGTVLGPAGMAVGGLVGVGVSLAPEIGRWLGGERGGETGAAVADMVRSATGTEDPDAALGVLAGDPARAMDLRVRLAQIAADREAERREQEVAEIKAYLADQQDARAKEIALVREKSPLAYGAAVVTLLLLGMFVYVIVQNPPMDEGMKETLKVLTVAAASYWIGSSRGSAQKDSSRVPAGAGRG